MYGHINYNNNMHSSLYNSKLEGNKNTLDLVSQTQPKNTSNLSYRDLTVFILNHILIICINII